MSFAPGDVVIPVISLLLTRMSRRLTALAAAALLAWLNLWWVLPLLGLREIDQAIPPLFAVAHSAVIMTVGHLLVIVLVLGALGVFSPRAGSPTELAWRAASRGDYRAAGEYWLEIGRPRRALRSFLRAHDWGRAAEVARSRGKLARAAELMERVGGESLGAAAQLYSRVGQDTRAQQTWLRYGQFLVENRRSEQAIDPFLRAGDLRRAAHAVELALENSRLTATNADVAIRAARESKRPALAAAVAVACARYREAGDLYLAAGQPLDAARAFEQGGETMRAAEALRLAGQTGEAARIRGQRLFVDGKLEQALQEYDTAGMVAEAAAALEKLGRNQEAFDRYRRAGL